LNSITACSEPRFPKLGSAEADVLVRLGAVGHNAAIEYATLRGFGVDNGVMILGPVANDASVGAKSVAPFTSVPAVLISVRLRLATMLQGPDAKHARVNRMSP
jgi:hypothetical protein